MQIVEGETLSFEQCKAAARDCLDRGNQHRAMAAKADAELEALDAVIVRAGHDPVTVVMAAYEDDEGEA